jgi:hypothetical protein
MINQPSVSLADFFQLLVETGQRLVLMSWHDSMDAGVNHRDVLLDYRVQRVNLFEIIMK